MTEKHGIKRIILGLFGLGAAVFILVSLASFSIYDRPNPDVAWSGPIQNLCGPVGAYLAYLNAYYLGLAGYVYVLAFMVGLFLYMLGKEIEQLYLRIIGIVLVGVVISATSWLINHGNANTLSHGNGGVLGIAVGHFLLVNTALTGAILILIAGALVGLLLSADNVLLLLPKLLLQIADRLRKAGPVLAEVSTKAGRISNRTREAAASAKKMLTMTGTSAVRDSLDEIEEDDTDSDYATALTPDVEAEETVENTNKTDSKTARKAARKAKESSAARRPVSTALAQMIRPATQQAFCPAGANAEDYHDYKYPPLELLEEPVRGYSALQARVVKERSKVLEQTLREFNLEAEVVDAETGPVITMFELKLAPGIKVSQISNLANDLARSLGAPAVRVVAPIPGKHTIGVEVPNSEKEVVRIKELLELGGDKPNKMQIPLFLGKDASGNALIVDLTEMPHCLIAGTTGSGKSVCINSIIISILLTQRPDMVKLILVDPKMVEMTNFRDIAHLMCPIVTEMKRAEQILEWLTEKMDERYALLAEARVRHIKNYNKLTEEELHERFRPSNEQEKAKIPLRLPYLVIIIDELADLMMTSAKEVEGYIIRLAQKSRAVGIHIVLATQRPQATVVTGLIKSNLPSRISFRVAARMDSRIVLDQNGAETLLGRGDMLFLQPGTSDLVRCQGSYVSDDEINRIVKFLKEQAKPNYHPELVQMNHLDASAMEKDELFDKAVRIILESKRGSVSLLQRRLTIGYSRASRLIDQMALAGIVGEYKGSQAREVLMSLDEYDNICRQMARDAAAGFSDLQEDTAKDMAAEISADGPVGDVVEEEEPVQEETATDSNIGPAVGNEDANPEDKIVGVDGDDEIDETDLGETGFVDGADDDAETGEEEEYEEYEGADSDSDDADYVEDEADASDDEEPRGE